jgi:phage virion morphogenesis protein
MATTDPFGQLRKRIDAALRRLPRQAGVLAVNHFQDNFRRQGFDGKPWKEVKRRLPTGGRTNRRGTATRLTYRRGAGRTRGILIQTGRLRRSIRITKTTADSVTVGTDTPYAAVHNEGLRAGRGSGFQMPKRQFIGTDRKLKQELEDLVKKQITAAFK